MERNDSARGRMNLQPKGPAYLRCTKCGHVNLTRRWSELDGRCPSESGCGGVEADAAPSDATTHRAYRASGQ